MDFRAAYIPRCHAPHNPGERRSDTKEEEEKQEIKEEGEGVSRFLSLSF